MKNRIKTSCFDGWEHFNVSTGKWKCGKKIIDNYNRIKGSRYIKSKNLVINGG